MSTRAPGTVYFVRGQGDLMKIGWTAGDGKRRIAEIQAMNGTPLATVLLHRGPRTLEKQLHRLFAIHRKHGEWFDLPEDWREKAANLLPDAYVEQQSDMASRLVDELVCCAPDAEIDVAMMLDALACAGLVLKPGDGASLAYFDQIGAFQK